MIFFTAKMNTLIKFGFIINLLIFSFVSAQEIKINGYGNLGYVFYNRNISPNINQEAYYEGKLKALINFNDKIEGQFFIKGESAKNSMRLTRRSPCRGNVGMP